MVKGCTEKIVTKIDSCTREDQYSAIIDSTQDLIPIIDKFGNSTEMIWNEVVADTETKKNELKNLVVETVDEQSCKVDKQSLAKLYAIHVYYTIKTKQLEVQNDKLKKELILTRHNVLGNISTDLQNVVELKQRELGLHAGLELLRERIKSMQAEQNVETIEVELEQLDACKMRVFDNINRKCDLIRLLHDDMMHTCDENNLEVAKLTNFTAKLDWIDSLDRNLILDEIRTSVQYPLRKHFCNLSDYVTGDHVDANSMVILSNLLENTWSPPETVLVGLVNAQHKLNVLKSLQATHTFNRGFDAKVCVGKPPSAEIIDKIMVLIMSCHDIEKKLKMVTECVHLWYNMKFKGFLSPRRFVDNRNYKYYEDLYNKFYQNFKSYEV
ncbi:hypothetical protein FQR65_LT06920 [Abscondita terminalis]|nr:hypothetical protein FQR65_LT06920 [Abscondita terminalis]